MRDLKLNTVCEEARCPNIGECWHHGTATFMILGDVCTRACGYCAVPHGKPTELDTAEPARVADAVAQMELQVRRHHVGRSRRSRGRRREHLRRHDSRDSRAHRLVPRRGADPGLPGARSGRCAPCSMRGPDVLNHNTETVPQPLPHRARGWPVPAHARTARSRAPVRAGHPDEERPDGGPRRGVGRARRRRCRICGTSASRSSRSASTCVRRSRTCGWSATTRPRSSPSSSASRSSWASGTSSPARSCAARITRTNRPTRSQPRG